MAVSGLGVAARLLSAAICAASVSACASQDRIAARMEEFVREGRIAGCVTLVAIDGRTTSLVAAGYRNLERRLPMRADTIFQVMSITKPVTAAAVMALAEEGRLAISDPVRKYLPDVDQRITIEQLLTHTSGLSGEDPDEIRDPAQKQVRPLSEVANLVARMPLAFEPGSRTGYSGPGYVLLGRIIERVSGVAYEKFVEQRFLKPLNMCDTFYFPPSDVRERIAGVYRLDKGILRPAGADLYRAGARYANPAGGLFSTAADIAAFCRIFSTGGVHDGRQVLSRESVREMLRPRVHKGLGDAATAYGLGWSIVIRPTESLPGLPRGAFGHSGAFGTFAWADPARHLVGVFLVQRTGATDNTERNAFLQLAMMPKQLRQ